MSGTEGSVKLFLITLGEGEIINCKEARGMGTRISHKD